MQTPSVFKGLRVPHDFTDTLTKTTGRLTLLSLCFAVEDGL